MTFVNLGTPPAADTVYPPWSQRLVDLVDKAICIGWERICSKYPAAIATGDEDTITNQLKAELVQMRREDQPPGFNSELFGIPTRDSKLPNASGKSIDQTPDLTIYPAHPRPGVADDQHDGLFYECKVLEGKRGLGLYRKEGILRFLDGRYAWRMPHAGMVAYVLKKTNTCAVKALTAYFARKAAGGKTVAAHLECDDPPSMAMASPHAMASDIARTKHRRTTEPGAPSLSEIELRHLWLLN